MRNSKQMVRYFRDIVDSVAPRLPYHNMSHMDDVASVAIDYATKEGIDDYTTFLIQTAAVGHDAVFTVGANDNEERTVYHMKDPLLVVGYTPGEVEYISGLILATKYPSNPKTIEEKILCDADIDNVTRDDFLVKSEALRLENGIDVERWYKELAPKFLDNVKLYTDANRDARMRGLELNKQILSNYKFNFPLLLEARP